MTSLDITAAIARANAAKAEYAAMTTEPEHTFSDEPLPRGRSANKHDAVTRQGAILDAIVDERTKQDAKWGFPQGHSLTEWVAVLTEEVGEVAQETLRVRFGSKSPEEYRQEVIQVAAVCVAMLEELELNAHIKLADDDLDDEPSYEWNDNYPVNIPDEPVPDRIREDCELLAAWVEWEHDIPVPDRRAIWLFVMERHDAIGWPAWVNDWIGGGE